MRRNAVFRKKMDAVMIEFSESIPESINHLKKALPKLVEHQLATNPLNYALWYTYISERIPELNNSLDQLVQSTDGYTHLHASVLFRRYLLNDPMADKQKAKADLQRIVQSTARNIVESIQCTDSLDQYISTSETALQSAQNRTELMDIIEGAATAFSDLRIQNKSAHEKLKNSERELEKLKLELARVIRIADIDPLTKLLNRAAIDRELKLLMASMKSGQHLSLIIGDIDYFKQFNDQFGHLMGDRVLQRVGTLIEAQVRESTLAARYGGEEFVVVMPDATLDEARIVAERLRDKVEQLRVKIRDTQQVLDNVTVSFGVATFQEQDSLESLFDRADKALYTAKAAGRNRVSTAAC